MANHFNFDERRAELAELKANKESRAKILGILAIEDRNLRRGEIYTENQFHHWRNDPKSHCYIPWARLQALHGAKVSPFIKASGKRVWVELGQKKEPSEGSCGGWICA